ncbi:MAG TPA: hypothetical protein VIB00_11875 [Pyrinomonadaceae bacterium]|jgi:hypothetical protein
MQSRRARVAALFVCLLLITSLPVTVVPKESKKKKPLPRGTAVMWQRPSDIKSRDLFLGPGGTAMRPDLRRITFLEEDKGGYSKKYRVRDASGREWSAKIGKEAQSETAAVRLLWAIGYVTEVNYLVPNLEIVGKGAFRNVRLEARPDNVKRLDEWKWEENPFIDTREFRGLKVMMALINNWDIKDSNNEILLVRGRNGNELRYIISDLGATFGKSSNTPLFWRLTRSRNEPEDYRKAKFVDEVEDNRVDFHYNGKRNGLFSDITISDAVWVGNLLSQLSNKQLRDAFRAANYTPSEIDILTGEVRERTNELARLGTYERLGRRR